MLNLTVKIGVGSWIEVMLMTKCVDATERVGEKRRGRGTVLFSRLANRVIESRSMDRIEKNLYIARLGL